MVDGKKVKADLGKTKNKGEVSEFYSFVYILGNGFIDLVDGNLKPLNNQIQFLKLIRSGIDYDIDLENQQITIWNGESKSFVQQEEIRECCDDLLSLILSSKNKIPENSSEIQSLKDILQATSLMAKASEKSDFRGTVQVSSVPGLHTLGFSVKSQLGSPATLVNSNKRSSAFQYEVVNTDGSPLKDFDRERLLLLNKDHTGAWIKRNVTEVFNRGFKLRFSTVREAELSYNLKMMDTSGPEIVSALLLEHYKKTSRSIRTIADLVKHISSNEISSQYQIIRSLSDNDLEVQSMLTYKVKRILCGFATGATVSTKWDGLDKANGGILVALKDGKVACLELFTRDALMQYLISTTKFDGPDPGRHSYGSFYLENGQLMLDLQLQIRFCN